MPLGVHAAYLAGALVGVIAHCVTGEPRAPADTASASSASRARALALVIYNANAVLEGGLAVIDTILPTEITERLARMVIEEFELLPTRRKVEIVPGTIGRLAPAMGAAELPLYHRYFSRTLFERTQSQGDAAPKKTRKRYQGEERRKTNRRATDAGRRESD